MTYVVRAPRVGDAMQIGALRNHVWRVAYSGLVPPDFLAQLDDVRAAAVWRSRLEEVNARGVDLRQQTTRVAVEVESDTVVGVAVCAAVPGAAPTSLEMRLLNVHPDHLGSGLGRRLLAVLTAARDCSMWVIERNVPAQLFLRRNGFLRTDQRRAHAETGVPEVLMVRRDWTAPGL